MNRTESYTKDLDGPVSAYLESGETDHIANFLASNSSLPGPRANLELASAFGEVLREQATMDHDPLLGLCVDFLSITDEQAPTNDPGEFLPFCGAVGIGVIGSMVVSARRSAVEELRKAANDARWRIREAVCFGLQHMLAADTDGVLKIMEKWIEQGTLLEARAAVVAVTEPRLLRQASFAKRALKLQELALGRIRLYEERSSDPFIILRKALAFTLSVVVAALPEAGFETLNRLASSGQKDLIWILRENLKKKRLIKSAPERVNALLAQLERAKPSE